MNTTIYLPTLIANFDGSAEKFRYDQHGMLIRRERSAADWEEYSYDKADAHSNLT